MLKGTMQWHSAVTVCATDKQLITPTGDRGPLSSHPAPLSPQPLATTNLRCLYGFAEKNLLIPLSQHRLAGSTCL